MLEAPLVKDAADRRPGGRARVKPVASGMRTTVALVKTGPRSGVRLRVDPCPVAISSTSAGMPIAQSFSQYCRHWTKVIPFIPPIAMLQLTTTPRMATPTQYGVPRTHCSVMPAPFI